jgi:hypothetical protein
LTPTNYADESNVILEISVSIVEDESLSPGDTFHTIVEIRNRQSEGRIDVIVTYEVINPKNLVILSDTKTVAVETKSSFAEQFTLPNTITEGTYRFHAVATTLDGSKSTEASRSFNVIVIEEGEQRIIEYIMVIALAITGGGLLIEHRRVSKLKVSGKDFKKFINEREENRY